MPPRVPPPPRTPYEELADLLLGEPVVPWIRQQRAGGRSWRTVARDLSTMTKGKVNVPHQTLIQWCDRDVLRHPPEGPTDAPPAPADVGHDTTSG